MITLQLDRELKTFEGKLIILDGQPWKLKDLILHYVGTYSSKDGKKVIEAYALGVKIAAHSNSDIILENAEFLLIKEATQTPQHGALLMGQLFEALDEAEKTKVSSQ